MSPGEASDTLPERILEALRARPNQKAANLSNALGLDRHEINSHLYRLKGRGIVAKDGEHRWSVSGTRPPRIDSPASPTQGVAKAGPKLASVAEPRLKVQESDAQTLSSPMPRHTGTRRPATIHDPMRPPDVFKGIEPIGVRGRPPKYIRTPKNQKPLALRNDMSRSARYGVAIAALVEEMKRLGACRA
jgi:hypothetical protein